MNNIQKLREAFSRALNIDIAKVTDSLNYQSISAWDSISHMVLISEIEQEFNISVDVNDVIDMSSFAKAKIILAKYNIEF